MTPLQSSPDGKVRIYERSTGQAIDRWPVDAQGMIGSGEYTADPPTGASPTPATVAAPPAPVLPPPVKANPLGIPNVTTHARDAAPGKPVALPVKRNAKAPKN